MQALSPVGARERSAASGGPAVERHSRRRVGLADWQGGEPTMHYHYAHQAWCRAPMILYFALIVLIWNLDPIETSNMCHRLRSGSRLACTQWVSKTRCRWWVVYTNMCRVEPRVEVFQGLWLPSPIRCRCCEGKNEGASWNLTCAHGDGSHSTWRKRFIWEREREGDTHILINSCRTAPTVWNSKSRDVGQVV